MPYRIFVLYREAKNMNLQVSAWMVLMESSLNSGESLTENLNKRCSLFLKVGHRTITLVIGRFLCTVVDTEFDAYV